MSRAHHLRAQHAHSNSLPPGTIIPWWGNTLRYEGTSRRGRAGALAHLGHFDEALADCDQAIRLDPEWAGPWVTRGHVLLLTGRFTQALADFDEAIRVSPQEALTHASRGLALMLLGRIGVALEAYDEALRLDQDDAWIHCRRGECLLLRGQHDEAAASLQRAADIQPSEALEPLTLLSALTWHHDQDSAAELARGALSKSGPSTTPPFRIAELRALAYLISGNPDDAAGELDAAAAVRLPCDLYQPATYDLLKEPPAPGLERLLAIWRQIDGGQHED